MSRNWPWPGSRWWRVDLHVHSPASHDFRPDEDRQKRDWQRWVEAARDAGLQAVAVTDHNTAEAIDEIKEAAASVAGAPTVLPGVELTASCGTHLLFIMDPAATAEHVRELLSLASVPTEARGDRDGRSKDSVERILRLAEECQGFFLAAHVNASRGLLRHDGQQRIQELRHPGLAGVEVDPGTDLDDSWLDGSRPEIGRRLARVWASDAHRFDDVGRRFTWMKMTEPTLEGLRLALMDGNDSSLQTSRPDQVLDPNRHASFVIESITVTDARYMGRAGALEVRLNPWLNAIIGGRGTGKSTLVDFCRKALRREDELEGTLREGFDRRLRVPQGRQDEGLLTESTVLELIYRKDGARFRIRWACGEAGSRIFRQEGDDWQEVGGDVRELFPVRIYSQKQLFELAQDPNALLAVIDETETVRASERRRRREELGENYMERRAHERAARARAQELSTRRAELEDVQRKLQLLQEGEDAAALTTFRHVSQANGRWRSVRDEALRRVDDLRRAAGALEVGELPELEALPEGPEREALVAAHERLRSVVDSLREASEAALAAESHEVEAIRSGTDDSIRAWAEAVERAERESQQASARLAESGISSPEEYRALVDRASSLQQVIEGLREEEGRADALGAEARGLLADYREQIEQLSGARVEFARGASDERLRVEVLPRSRVDQSSIVGILREALGIDRFDNDHERLAARLAPEGQAWSWQRLDQLVQELEVVRGGGEAPAAYRDQRFVNAVQRLPPERLDRLALAAPEDRVEVSRRDPPSSSWRALSVGSPGQQTAALLSFVLGFGREPIFLDQPEDDLDNTLIYEMLVPRLRASKLSRQLIVVTHDPNIVVHGDAELVLSLDVGGGQTQVRCHGGLQEKQVRGEVCRVMEGGRKAFEERYQRLLYRSPGQS